MKILITGVNGQVGHALMHHLNEYNLVGLTRQDCDLTNLDLIKDMIDRHQPDLIINPAAYTKVDQAEDESDLAYRINLDVPRVMAEKSREYCIPFIHFSTDYIFDGVKDRAYKEKDMTNPLSVYGKSKLAGEEAIQEVGGQFFIFRSSWVYSNIGNNFFLTIKRKISELNELKVVDDQYGSPTSNIFISEQIKLIIPKLNQNNSGIYHLVPDGSCSWYEFAKIIITKTNSKFNINNLKPIKSVDFSSKAKRPQNGLLDNKKIKKTFMLKFDNWQNELAKVLYEA